ncbi:hypothetical protein TBR22_A00330 [Luteitalea sp. TBR-22]|nr:hypothetical protein TBR22_A00330 [Luteitalea sp. TBR-22]
MALALTGALVLQAMPDLGAQVRTARRGGAVKTEDGGAAVGRRGAAVKTEDGAAAVTRRGAAVKTEEGVSTVSRGAYGVPPRGAVAVGEEGAAAVTRRGAVVVGEEGAAAVGRYGYRGGVVVYEDNDAWRTAAGIAVGVAAGIAIGTMLAKPPKQATTVVVSSTTYYYDAGTFYTKAMHEGQVVYQVVAPPVGAVITTLPAGCTSVTSGGVTYSQCGQTRYQRVSSGYQVVVVQ